ncbi:hypothetical protein LIER_16356 [Lithospermum erythrorhizon]|uniref:Reverse transcriptase Ty1/copia-type domain-containing protein n=1 Tax=Lithospermum erythrorhizon TaxID=34254 RepID=A0AAV3Q780_LITER
MKDLCDAKQILGMRIIRDRDSLRLTQEEYLKKVIKRFNMLNAKPVSTPIAAHFQLSVERSPETEDELVYMDKVSYASAVGSLMRSSSGYVFLFSTGAVAWSSKKQPIVTLSTTEAEFVAAAVCTCQGIWMKGILMELGYDGLGCIKINCDNSSTIKLSKNPVMHGRTKHIDVRFYFLRDLSREGKIVLQHCGTREQVADVMTKPLKLDTFQRMKIMMGMKSAAWMK